MNPVLEQLLALTGRLEVSGGTKTDSLASLRRLVAATLIQQNPAALPLPPDTTVDPAILAAATEGAAFAAELSGQGTSLRFVRESYVTPGPNAERPTEILGPLLDADGTLVRFLFFRNERFLAVQLRIGVFPIGGEVLMLLPRDSALNAGGRSITIAAGTVWIRARFLTAGTAGYAGLRVTGGSVEFDQPALPLLGRRLSVFGNVQWTLTVEPEQPSAAAEGSDANSITLGLPAQLVVRSAGPPEANGPISMSGFGSDIEFRNRAGSPVAGATSIVFAYEPEGAVWSINGNRSAAAQLAGECPVATAAWTLPLTQLAAGSLGEAAHGGSLEMRLLARLDATFAGMNGAFRAFDTRAVVNGRRIELNALQADSSARLDLDLWTPARTECVFAQSPITRVFFASERDGPDVALASGGRLRNLWDVPLTAAGKPFSYEGTVEQFAIISNATGLHLACIAIQQPEAKSRGVALENVYLVVRQPRRLAFAGTYDGISTSEAGAAVLSFDVLQAQPSLPDPYAANWPISADRFIAEAALSLTVRWTAAERQAVQANLERPVQFPTPSQFRGDEDDVLRALFDRHLGTESEFYSMMDLSSADHHFGVALETLLDVPLRIAQNRLSVELRDVRLLMQPQVQWEPVQVEPNPDAATPQRETVRFTSNGARTLAGTTSVKLVPVLPGAVCAEIVESARQRLRCGVLFSLPFGLRAFTRMDALGEQGAPFPIPAIETALHEPRFGTLTSARQLRLTATGFRPANVPRDPARTMPGAMRQLRNLTGSVNGLTSVLSGGIDTMLGEFANFVPLHHADLSGYGLSTFSDWRRNVNVGVVQVRFDVLNGRTSYEVVQARSVMAFCQCHVVRTIILERRNSGKVLRFDSGWQPTDDGEFKPYADFEKGVVKAFRKIRRIRILNTPLLTLTDGSIWQPVLFDADADLENLVAGGSGDLTPIRDHAGYIQLWPVGPGAEPTRPRFAALFQRLGAAAGGPADCEIRAGGTLAMQLSGIFADDAPNDAGLNPAFVLAAYGSPKLPRAGQWSAVRINGATSEAAPVDPRRGVPVIRRPGQPYRFLDPSDVQRSKPNEYGFLMATQTSRVLFPKPSIDPNAAGRLSTAEPVMADPYSLVQSSSAFPRPTFALRCKETANFDISAGNAWRLVNGAFSFDTPAPDLAKGGEWALKRVFPPGPRTLDLLVDSMQGTPWDIGATPSDLNLDIDPFPGLFVIRTSYKAMSGALPKLQKPTLDFGPALSAVKEVLDSLKHFTGLPFDFDVDVTAGNGPSPSFIVRIRLKFRIGEGPNERIDIGVGKFYGEFVITGELEAALTGGTRGLLSAEFQGDIQQGILPPLLYAGGLFRFAIQILDTGKPVIELGLGATASIGGDLIKGLVEVEVTVKYGYMLIPETLQPGVLLGLEARAKILSGLVGFSFAVQAMARIQRVSDKSVHIWAEIRVAATVQVAWLIEEDVDLRTQFEQKIPLAVAALAGGAGLLPAAALL